MTDIKKAFLEAVKELYEETNDDKLLEDIERLQKEVDEEE